jgi:hypothetical protein
MPNTPPIREGDADTLRSLPRKHDFCHLTANHTLLDEDLPSTNHKNNLIDAFLINSSNQISKNIKFRGLFEFLEVQYENREE